LKDVDYLIIQENTQAVNIIDEDAIEERAEDIWK
jgi:hypothetical protein